MATTSIFLNRDFHALMPESQHVFCVGKAWGHEVLVIRRFDLIGAIWSSLGLVKQDPERFGVFEYFTAWIKSWLQINEFSVSRLKTVTEKEIKRLKASEEYGQFRLLLSNIKWIRQNLFSKSPSTPETSSSHPPVVPSQEEIVVTQKASPDKAELLSALKKYGIEKQNHFYFPKKQQEMQKVLFDLKEKNFFQIKSHARAKEVFHIVMKHLNLNVAYVDAKDWDYGHVRTGELDEDLFCWNVTQGVEHDIEKATQDIKNLHLFTVASQYNAAEAPTPFIPQVATAMAASKHDSTQGPLAQRTNPTIFECVNAFLPNLGFNMMTNVLPSAGETYDSNTPIACGYLRPNSRNLSKLSKEMMRNFKNFETVCYESRPSINGQPLFLILGAAPALGYSDGFDVNSKACKCLQYWAFIANFTTLFKQAMTLLQKYPNKKIVVHVTGTGLGVFGCDEKIFANAFKQVALQFQEKLPSQLKKRIRIQLDSYKGKDALRGDAPDYMRYGDKRKTVSYDLHLRKKRAS